MFAAARGEAVRKISKAVDKENKKTAPLAATTKTVLNHEGHEGHEVSMLLFRDLRG